MPKYEIWITRKATTTKIFNVEAKDKPNAIEQAYDKASNTVYDEDNAEYELSYIREEPRA